MSKHNKAKKSTCKSKKERPQKRSNPTRAEVRKIEKCESRVKSGNPQLVQAPVTSSGFRQQYCAIKGSSTGELVLQACIPFMDVSGSTSLTTAPLLDSANNLFYSITLSPTKAIGRFSAATSADAYWLSPVFDSLGSTWAKFRIDRLGLHYEPSCATSDPAAFVLAFSDDPINPYINPDSAVPTAGGLSAVPDSKAFSAWEQWSMDLTRKLRVRDWLFTRGPTISAGTVTQVTKPAEVRQSCIGILGAVQRIVSNATGVKGRLYLELQVTFTDFTPIAYALLPDLDHRVGVLRDLRKRQVAGPCVTAEIDKREQLTKVEREETRSETVTIDDKVKVCLVNKPAVSCSCCGSPVDLKDCGSSLDLKVGPSPP